MTNEELKAAMAQQRREQVDVNIGQVSLRPTAQPGGQYGVQVQSTPKENSYTQIAKALNQFPQLAGQYANIQKAAGQREIEALSPEELEERAKNGDQNARETLFNRFKLEGINEALFNARYETVIFPGLAAKEQMFKDMRPEEVEALFQDENGNPLESQDVIENLRLQYSSVIPEDVKTNPNQKVMYNKLLRQLNGVATKSYAVLEQKRQKFLDDGVYRSINQSANNFNLALPTRGDEDNVEVTDDAGVAVVTQGANMLPSPPRDEDDTPPVVRSKISVYSPQQKGPRKKMEGGYESKWPGADGKRIVRTLEDFRKDPDNTVVTVAGNPEFYGRRYVVESMTYQTADGKQYTLSNVPVMVHDTGDRFKTAPEGRFDIPVERDTDNPDMETNEGLLKDIQFIRDKGSESGKPVKVKRTAAELTKQRAEDIGTKQEFLAKDMFNAMNTSLNEALAKATKGSSLTEMQLRSSNEGAFQDKFNEMILNDQHVQVQSFIDLAQGKGPNGESIPPMLVGGERVSPQMITNLQRAVWAQENRLATTDPERSEAEEKALKESGIRLSRIGIASPKISLEDTNKAIAQDAQEFEAEALEKGWSQDTKDEYYKQVAQLKDRLPLLGAGTRWNGLYLTPDFLENLDRERDPNRGFQRELMSEREFLRVAKTEGIDLKELEEMDAKSYVQLGPARQKQWDSITNGIMSGAMTAGAPLAIEELALLYQEEGERDYKKDIVIQDRDDEGNLLTDENGQPKMVRAGVLYQKLLRKHMTRELTKLIRDTKEQKKLIQEAMRIKGPSVDVSEDRLERQAKATKLEETEGRDDFLDKEGRSTRQYGEQDSQFTRNDGDFLDRWVKTATNPEALALMEAQTERDKLDSDLNNVFSRITPKYLKSAVLDLARQYGATKKLEVRNRLETQLKYIGLPMNFHTDANGMLIEVGVQGFERFDPETAGSGVGFGLGPNVPRTVLDLNRSDRYSNPETAKTHIYNYYAVRDTRFEASEEYDPYEKLNRLYDLYFKGQESTYSRETFHADQEALAKQLKINPSK